MGVGGDEVGVMEKGKEEGGGYGKEGQWSSKSRKRKGRHNKHSSYDFFFCCCSVKCP